MFIPTVKIKYGWVHEVSWAIVLLFLMDYLGIQREVQFLITVGLFLCIVMFSKRIFIPKVLGWNVYIFSLFCMFVYGMIKNPIQDVEKGSFYILNTVVMVMLGYYLCIVEKKKSFEKTIYVIGLLICIRNWISLLLNPSVLMDMQQLRDAFKTHIMDLMIIGAVLFFICVIQRKQIFGKRLDRFVLGLLIVTIFASLGRTQIFCLIVGIMAAYMAAFAKSSHRQYLVKSFIAILFSGMVLIVLALNVLPEETISPFIEKVSNSISEVSINNEFDNVASINSNWRGYENKNANEQWMRANVLEEIIGQGIGRKVELIGLDRFNEQKYGLDHSNSPILHSGYHTLLVKGGLLSVVGLGIWFIFPLVKLITVGRNNKKKIDIYIKLLTINMMMVIATYVVRGVIGNVVFMGWALAMGWYSCELNHISEKSVQDSEEIN